MRRTSGWPPRLRTSLLPCHPSVMVPCVASRPAVPAMHGPGPLPRLIICVPKCLMSSFSMAWMFRVFIRSTSVAFRRRNLARRQHWHPMRQLLRLRCRLVRPWLLTAVAVLAATTRPCLVNRPTQPTNPITTHTASPVLVSLVPATQRLPVFTSNWLWSGRLRRCG